MEYIHIRRMKNNDAIAVSKIIGRNFLEVNTKDYSKEEMEHLSKIYSPDKILEISGYAHMYVVCIDHKVVGCGAISSFWGKLVYF